MDLNVKIISIIVVVSTTIITPINLTFQPIQKIKLMI